MFFLLFFVLLNIVIAGETILIFEWSFRENFLVELSCPLVLDLISCLFCITVLFISGCVMVFSGFYISHEKFLVRFIGLVLLFVLSIVSLILFPNFLFIIIGWDGLGVVSFLLVVYYRNSDSLSAGMITAIRNRVGDALFILLLGLISCYLRYSSSDKYLIVIRSISILCLFGSLTKRAQIPFSAWLPEAIAAPTPVSTLVHSSTLVTAGVYVLIRFGRLLTESSYYILLFLSIITVIMAGIGGVVETDIKKVVALSTLRQVGIIMFSIRIGAMVIAFFHLLVHAFFKALIFMCVGGVIYYSGGVQDARNLGGLWYKIPFTCRLLLFTNLSLIGFPFMSGFYSKEMILGEFLIGNWRFVGVFILFLSLVLTTSYAVRIIALIMSSCETSSIETYKDYRNYYLLPLLIISNGAVFLGLVVQIIRKDVVFFVLINSKVFYRWFSLFGCWALNIFIILSLIGKNKWIKILIHFFLRKIWFLKEIRGNLIRSKGLLTIRKFISLVEMGWVRGYIWGDGVKKLTHSSGGLQVRKINFKLIGFVLFFSSLLWLLILL